jgi:hypothetical protein
MSKERPDHHDAELAIRVYELRREETLRRSRDLLNQKFWPKSYEDVLALTKSDNPMNQAYRQVGTYWELVYGMVKHGVVHPGYFLETNGEGFFLLAKVVPYLEQLRKDVSALAFRNAEWVAKECPEGQRLFETISARVKKLAESR